MRKYHSSEVPVPQMIVLDPSQRITAETALKHPFVERYIKPEDEPVLEVPLSLGNENLSLEQLRQLVWDEVQNFPRSV